MRAAIFSGPGSITLGERPDATIVDATDAVVRVVLTSVCGSDLWFYRGDSPYAAGSPIGHELIGIVEAVGAEVRTVKPDDFVIAPFAFSDGTCAHCRRGMMTACVQGGTIPRGNGDGAQGEAVRIPFADGTLVRVPGSGHSDLTLASLLTLSDVMGTGEHAAVCSRVQEGDTVAVVGDGAVGLCAVLAAKRHGATRIVVLSRHPDRQRLATEFGATDIVADRGEQAIEAILELTGGIGVDATLECVGTGEAMTSAVGVARPGSLVGYVGIPHDVELPIQRLFVANKGLQGGPAPTRRYLPELLEDVLADRIHPGRVFDFVTDLAGVPDA